MTGRPLAAWLSLLLIIFVALVKTILTKIIFEKLPTPVAYSLISAVVTWLLLALPLAATRSLKVMQLSDMARLMLVSVAVTLDLGMSNVAIERLPLPLQQALASVIPAATILIETAVTRRLKPVASYVAIALLCCGAGFMHLGSGRLQTNVSGAAPPVSSSEAAAQAEATLAEAASLSQGEAAMAVAILAAAIKSVFAKASLHAWKESTGAVGVLFWIETFISFQLLPWAMVNGELVAAVGILTDRGPAASALVCAAAALGGFRFYCELLVLRYWSATTLAAANLMAHALIVAIAMPLSAVLPLGAPPPSLLTLAGTAVTLVAAMLYAALKVRGSLEPPSLPPSPDGKIRAGGATGGGFGDHAGTATVYARPPGGSDAARRLL